MHTQASLMTMAAMLQCFGAWDAKFRSCYFIQWELLGAGACHSSKTVLGKTYQTVMGRIDWESGLKPIAIVRCCIIKLLNWRVAVGLPRGFGAEELQRKSGDNQG